MPDSGLAVARHGAVAVVTLDRPERRNALTHDLVVGLREALAELDAAGDVRAIVLTGSGDRAFCAGADLRGDGGPPITAGEVVRRFYNPLVTAMVEQQTPLLAAVNGVAAGAGMSLALACDLRIASRNARFQLAFVGVGLVPDAGSTWLLPRAVGSARAAEMALLGRAVEADEALAWGLVNRVVPDGEALRAALQLAGELAAGSTVTSAIRQLLHRSASRTLRDQLAAEAAAQEAAAAGPDYAEARLAFVEKRPPRFRTTEPPALPD